MKMESRLENLKNLSKYLDETKDRINFLKNELGWCEKSCLYGTKQKVERTQVNIIKALLLLEPIVKN